MGDRQTIMNKAFMAVKAGMKVRQAAREFGVPRTTLRNKVDGKHPLEKISKLSLTVEEENIFSQWVINMARTGFGRTIHHLHPGVSEPAGRGEASFQKQQYARGHLVL